MKVIFSLDIVRGFLAGIGWSVSWHGHHYADSLFNRVAGLERAEPVIVIGIFVGVITYLVAAWVFSLLVPLGRQGDRTDEEPNQPQRGWTRYFNVDTNHKVIGIQYIVTSLIFLPFAVALQLVGRLDLSKLIPALSPNAYESIVSVHGLMMFFIVVIPAFTGLMNYLIPLRSAPGIWLSRALMLLHSGYCLRPDCW